MSDYIGIYPIIILDRYISYNYIGIYPIIKYLKLVYSENFLYKNDKEHLNDLEQYEGDKIFHLKNVSC